MNHNIKRHPFHLVDPSPWPFLGSISALAVTLGAVYISMGFIKGSSFYLVVFFIFFS